MATSAWGHGGQPQVTDILFPSQFPGSAWALTDNQGVYVASPAGVERFEISWLCEDSVAPSAGILGVAPLTEDRWILATGAGLFVTEDRGCNYAPAPAPVDTARPIGISTRPDLPLELAVATDTFGGPNDVFVTEDGGRTWQGAGLGVRGPIWQLVRSQANPDEVYIISQSGAQVSEDGGRTFGPMKLGPRELQADPLELRLLTAPPGRPGELFAIVERFPAATLVRSESLGQDWVSVMELSDFPVKLVFDSSGDRALVVSAFGETLLSEDGGRTFSPTPEVPQLLCLDRQPGTDRLWGCTNVFFNGPWVLGVSDDFGRTWQPIFERYEQIDARWRCAPDDQASLCCDSLCPGLPAGGTCDDASPDPPPPQCNIAPNPPDAGPPPPDADVDAGPPPDADLRPDGSPPLDARAPDAGLRDARVADAGPDGSPGADAGGADSDASDRDAAPQGDAGDSEPSGDGGGGSCDQSPAGPWRGLMWFGLLLWPMARRRR